jgi:hypothetical protein
MPSKKETIMRKDHRFEDPDAFDERGILKDGAVARVRMQMRDGSPDRPLTHDELMLKMIEHDAKRRRSLHVDAGDPAPFALNRPGFRHLVAADGDRRQQDTLDAARQRVLDARAKYISDLEGAWKTPQPDTGAGRLEHASPVEGGLCSTPGGFPGTYQFDEESGEMVCIANPRVTGDSSNKTLAQLQRDHAIRMESCYAAYEREISEAWRTK